MSDLKPCPFCGGPGYVDKQFHNSVRKPDYVAGCDSSVCNTLSIIVEGKTKQECIDKWNTRQQPTKEQVKEVIDNCTIREGENDGDFHEFAAYISADELNEAIEKLYGVNR